eukprot:TRINITY_DN3978_c1_g1_i1.p1 TRINITY_DN3978_c1_g1~~TRINITY_DN3978_c1_g1_i1.p1  ORF type:complete len:293 (-),score=41.48 TRINITY_DN3978_c1_g1_i1:174-1052(-)
MPLTLARWLLAVIAIQAGRSEHAPATFAGFPLGEPPEAPFPYTRANVGICKMLVQEQALWMKARLLFIHVPRTGGTYLRFRLQRAANLVANFQLPHHMLHYYADCGVNLAAFRASTVFKIVTIVRNPWERAVSAYRYLREQAKDSRGCWSAACRLGLKAVNRSSSFASFVTAELPSLSRSIHLFRPQHYFWRDSGASQLSLKMLRFERLEDDVDALFAQQGLDSKNYYRGVFGPALQDWCKDYTQEAADAVAHLYQEDIARLGYTFDCEPAHLQAKHEEHAQTDCEFGDSRM